MLLLGAALLVPQAAQAFFCFKSGPSTKYFGRSVPFSAPLQSPTNYPLPPIMPYGGAIAPGAKPLRPPPPPRPLSFRPLRR